MSSNCEDIVNGAIYAGDDTSAFGRNFITIKAPTGLDSNLISCCIFQCGPISKKFENPNFPLYVNLDSSETKKLDRINHCYLVCEDSDGRRVTLNGTLVIKANKQVVADDESAGCNG